MDFDVIVVGAGPAGAMAAKTAGENGLRVALLERRKNLDKLTRPCVEGLLCHKYEYGEYVKVNPRDRRIVFPFHGFSIKYEGPLKGVYKFINFSADGHTMEMNLYIGEREEVGEILTQHVAIDKERLIKGLLNEARENHVEIFPGVNVSGAEKTEEGVVIMGNGETFEGTYALAADGLNSRMVRQLGFNKDRKFFGTLRGKVWHMRGVNPPDPEAHIHIAEGVDAPPLFCICPRAVDDEYFIMVGGYTPFIDFDIKLNQVMKDSWFSPWFKKAEILRKFACVLNLFSPIAEPFKDNALLIGDAAALGQISTHNAILSGWKAANTITVSLIDRTLGKEGVSGYLEWWKRNFFDPHRLLPVDFTDILTREEINFVFSLFKEPIPASARVEDSQKVMAEAMAKIMPDLKTERPNIFTKITNLRKKPVEETWAERRKSGFPVM